LPLSHVTVTVFVGRLYRTMGVEVGPGSLVKVLYVLLTLGFSGQMAAANVAFTVAAEPEIVPNCLVIYFSLVVKKPVIPV